MPYIKDLATILISREIEIGLMQIIQIGGGDTWAFRHSFYPGMIYEQSFKSQKTSNGFWYTCMHARFSYYQETQGTEPFDIGNIF
jgi:hypothetical protein